MIRGVQRQVIEISHTDNAYFERALLVVRSTCAADHQTLRQQAHRYLEQTGTSSFLRRGRVMYFLHRILSLLISAGLGALICKWILQ